MSLHRSDTGARITRANLADVTDPVPAPTDPLVTVIEDLNVRSEFGGGSDRTTATGDDRVTKAFKAGDRVRESELLAYLTPADVDAITPAGGAAVGGTAVTITGTGLDGVTGVTFGGVAATGVVVDDPRTVRCVAPAHAAGAVNVVVQDDDGAVTVVGGYTYA